MIFRENEVLQIEVHDTNGFKSLEMPQLAYTAY